MVGQSVGNAACDVQGSTCICTDGRIPRHGDRSGISVVAGDTLKLAAEVQTTDQLVANALCGEGIADGDVVGELKCRPKCSRVWSNHNGTRASRVVVAQPHRACVDVQPPDGTRGTKSSRSPQGRSRPARVVGCDFHHAIVILMQKAACSREGEGIGDRENITGSDLENVVRLVQIESACCAEGARGAEANSRGQINIQGHRVPCIAEGSIGIDGEDTIEDINGLAHTAEGIHSIQHQGAWAGLDEPESGSAIVHRTRKDKTLNHIGTRSHTDCKVSGTRHGRATGELETITVLIGNTQDVSRNAQAAALQGFVASIGGGTGTVHRDGRITGEGEVSSQRKGLKRAKSIAVARKDQATRSLDGASIVAYHEDTKAGLVDDVREDRGRGIGDGHCRLRSSHNGIPDGRQCGDAVESDVVHTIEDGVAQEGEVVRNRHGGAAEESCPRSHRHGACPERTGNDAVTNAARGAAGTDDEATGGDIHTTCKGALATQLKHTSTGLHNATVLDDGVDGQARLPWSDVFAIDHRCGHIDREAGIAIEVNDAVADRGDDTSRSRGGGDAARECQRAGRIQERAGSAIADEIEATQGIRACESGDGTAIHGQHLGRDDAASLLSEGALVHGNATEAEGTCGTHGKRSRIHHGAARVGVGSGEEHHAVILTRSLNKAKGTRAIVGNGRTDGDRAVGAAVVGLHEVKVTRRIQDTAGESTVGDGEINVVRLLGKENAAAANCEGLAIEIDHGGGVLRSKVQRSQGGVIGQHRGASRGKANIVRRKWAGIQTTAIIGGHSCLPEGAHPIGGVIRRVFAIHNGPRSDEVVGERDSTTEEDPVGGSNDSHAPQGIEAQCGRRGRSAVEGAKVQSVGVDAAACQVGEDAVVTIHQSKVAKGLGDIALAATVQGDVPAHEGDRGSIIDAVRQAVEVAIAQGQAATADRNGRRVGEGAFVGNTEGAAIDEGRTCVGVGFLEVEGVCSRLVQVDGSGDLTVEIRVAVGHKSGLRTAVGHRAATEIRVTTTTGAAKAADEVNTVLQVHCRTCIHSESVVEEQGIGCTRIQIQCTRVHRGGAAVKLLLVEVQHPIQRLSEATCAADAAGNIQRHAGAHMDNALSTRQGDDRNRKGCIGAGAVDENTAAGDRQSGRIQPGQSADIEAAYARIEGQCIQSLVTR